MEDFLGCNQKERQLVVGGIGRKVKILQTHIATYLRERKRLFDRKKGEGNSG